MIKWLKRVDNVCSRINLRGKANKIVWYNFEAKRYKVRCRSHSYIIRRIFSQFRLFRNLLKTGFSISLCNREPTLIPSRDNNFSIQYTVVKNPFFSTFVNDFWGKLHLTQPNVVVSLTDGQTLLYVDFQQVLNHVHCCKEYIFTNVLLSDK